MPVAVPVSVPVIADEVEGVTVPDCVCVTVLLGVLEGVPDCVPVLDLVT